MKKITNTRQTRQSPVAGDITARVREALGGFKGASLSIAQYLLDDPASVTVSAIGELAALTQTSAASVTRFCRAIGVESYSDLRLRLASELGRSSADPLRSDAGDHEGQGAIATQVSRLTIRVLQRAADALDENQVQACAKLLIGANRVVLFGIGGSATAAQEAQLRLHLLGLPVWAPVSFHDAMVAASLLQEHDVLFAISRSGRTTEVITVAEQAREQGAQVIALTSFGVAALAGLATLSLLLPAEELDTGHGAAAVKYGQLLVVDAVSSAVKRQLDSKANDALARSAQALAPFRSSTRARSRPNDQS